MMLTLLFMLDFQLGILNLKNAEELKEKISEELMQVAWHPNRWWKFCVPEDDKKKKQSRFLLSNAFNLYNLRVLKSL